MFKAIFLDVLVGFLCTKDSISDLKGTDLREIQRIFSKEVKCI